jgi:hypothetical protein
MPQSVQTPDSRILWPPQHSPATSKVFAQNTIEIAASPDTIWTLLIDCVRWPSWYKHCSDVSILRGGPLLSGESKFRFKTLGFYFEPEIDTFNLPECSSGRQTGPPAPAVRMLGISSRHRAVVVSAQKKPRRACSCFFLVRVRAGCSLPRTRNGYGLSKS